MTEKHLLFAVLAFESDLIDLAQLTAVCRAWVADKSKPIADLLVERGWITVEDRGFIEKQLERKLAKHQHDPRVTLNSVVRGDVCDAIKEINDADIQQSLSSWPSSGPVLIETIGETLGEPEQPKSRYTWVSEVGKGGLGKVWLARDNDLAREVALKEVKPGSASTEAVRRLIKEAQITGQLQHPNIVPVYEVNRGSRPFYTMKLVKGETLLQAIQRHHQQRREGKPDPLLEQRLMSVFLNVCDAIAYAHSRGIIHRDLKPDNVVLGDYGEAIVLDWGLARRINSTDEETAPVELSEDICTDATQAGQKLGTPAYMSPEQASGRVDLIDQRTDIYGLGAILFQILTGEPPHSHASDAVSFGDEKACSLAALLRRIANGDPPHVRDRDISLGNEFDELCAKAMAKRRDERFQTVKELKSTLLEYQIHKESIDLAAHATRQLDLAKQSGNHQDFNRARFGFEEALRKWPENKAADDGIVKTQIARVKSALESTYGADINSYSGYQTALSLYNELLREWPANIELREALTEIRLNFAKLALANGDFDLGLSVIDTNADSHEETRHLLVKARLEREGRVRLMKVLKWTAIVLLIGFGGVSFLAAKGQLDLAATEEKRKEAVAATNQANADRLVAVEERKQAKKEANDATVAAEMAKKEKELADEMAIAANAKAEKAAIAQTEAEKAKEKAEGDTKAAVIAKMKADDDTKAALIAKMKADDDAKALLVAKTMADKAAKAAQAAKMKADSDRRKAEYQKGLADVTRIFYEGDYPETLRRLTILKVKYQELCKEEWDQLHNAASAPDRVSMSKPVESISLSRDGTRLVGGDTRGHVGVWRIDKDGKLLDEQPTHRFELGSRLRAVAASSDGDSVAAAGDDGLIRVWSLVANAEQPPLVLKGHKNAVNTLKFSGDGKRLASGSDDRTVRLWALDSTATIAGTRTSFPVTCLDWSRDGAILVATTRGDDPRGDDEPHSFKPYRLVAVPKVSPPIDDVQVAEDAQMIAEVGDDPPGFARAYSWRVVTKDNSIRLNLLRKYDGPLGSHWAERSFALQQLRTREGLPMRLFSNARGEGTMADNVWDEYLYRALRPDPWHIKVT